MAELVQEKHTEFNIAKKLKSHMDVYIGYFFINKKILTRCKRNIVSKSNVKNLILYC